MPRLTSELVTAALRLLEGKTPGGAEAERLARLVESREEFLAHLLLRRKSFAAHPELLAAFERAATSALPAAQTTRRREQDDAARQRAAHQELEETLRGILTEVERLDKNERTAESAISRFVQQAPAASNTEAGMGGTPLVGGQRELSEDERRSSE
ncbi:MAG TPA: hypothetical protein VG651_15330 [Stellaceae bacterium]|nr:hypothetical protein [Stellaceae bacterium]